MRDYTRIPSQYGIVQPKNIVHKQIDNKRDNPSINSDFQEILNKKIKISQHAKMRMDSRNINLDKEQLEKLNKAVDKAAQKGVKESLIIMDKQAFIVSVKNRTLITAVDESNMKENVFTNIDGAVIM